MPELCAWPCCRRCFSQSLAPELLDGGEQLFGGTLYEHSWVFQQDGARVHWTDDAQRVAGQAPGGLLQGWPANSPDLSLIENVWAGMADWIRKQPAASTLDELWELIQRVRAAVPPEMLRNCYKSMADRLRRVTACGGATL